MANLDGKNPSSDLSPTGNVLPWMYIHPSGFDTEFAITALPSGDIETSWSIAETGIVLGPFFLMPVDGPFRW